MGLLSFLKRNEGATPAKPVADGLDEVQRLRIRARRRLIGAAVLVGVAVIVFPLLFETQPRPIPVDLPIDIPRKEAAPPLAIPAPPAAAEQGQGIISESREQAQADRERPAAPVLAQTKPAAEPVAPAAVQERPAPRPEPKASMAEPAKPPKQDKVDKQDKPAKPERSEKAEKTEKSDKSHEAARVQALLDGRSPDKKASDSASTGRFIVQVGAYADGKAAQEARMKVERLGLKTYTQVVDTADGKRIRVRVGPYASREEADKAAAKVRGGGLSTAVLTL